MMPGKIKLFWQVSAALVFWVTGIAAFVLWPRVDTGELYKSYAGRQDIDATFLHAFPLGDTVTVDVTILHAATDSSWGELLKDFSFTPIPQEALEFLGMESRKKSFKKIHKPNQMQRENETISDSLLIVIQEDKYTLSIFQLENRIQYDAIFHDNLSQIKNNNEKSNKNSGTFCCAESDGYRLSER